MLRDRTRRERLTNPLVVGGIVAGLTLALHLRDPHSSGSWGYCPWYAMTGKYCPGCGGLRAVNDLTNGDVLGAASSNVLLIALIPVAVLWWVGWTRRSWTGASSTPGVIARHPSVVIGAGAVVLVVFTVLRNTAWGSWLAP